MRNASLRSRERAPSASVATTRARYLPGGSALRLTRPLKAVDCRPACSFATSLVTRLKRLQRRAPRFLRVGFTQRLRVPVTLTRPGSLRWMVIVTRAGSESV